MATSFIYIDIFIDLQIDGASSCSIFPLQLHPRIDASDQAANLGVLLIGAHHQPLTHINVTVARCDADVGKYFGRFGIMYGEGLSLSKSKFSAISGRRWCSQCIGGILILEKASRFQLIFS